MADVSADMSQATSRQDNKTTDVDIDHPDRVAELVVKAIKPPAQAKKEVKIEKHVPFQAILNVEDIATKEGEGNDVKYKIEDSSKLKKAMEDQTKEKDLKVVKFDYKDEGKPFLGYFNIESLNTDTIEEQKKDQVVYEQRMISDIPDIDNFITNEFSVNGMKNIYGNSQQEFKDSKYWGPLRDEQYLNNPVYYYGKNKNKLTPNDKFELVDCSITVLFHERITYFVVTGYQKGYKFNEWTHAQGRSVLRIYKMDPDIKKSKRGNDEGWVLPEILILDEVLNNIAFKYSPFKNYNPILIHNMNIYFYKISNHFHGGKPPHMLDMWLYKINLTEKEPKKKEMLRWFDALDDFFVTHFSFISIYPDLNITTEELEATGGAIMYFRSYPEKNKTYQMNLDEEDESGNYEQKIRRVGLCKANMWFLKQKEDGPDHGAVIVKDFDDEVEFKIPDDFMNNTYPQPYHMWVLKNGELLEVSKDDISNLMYHDVKSNFLSKPYFYYRLENGVHKRTRMAQHDQEQDFSKLKEVFDIQDDDVNFQDSDDSSDDEDEKDNKEIQSICIIDDHEDFEFSVFYVYGGQFEFKRYKNQRLRPMEQYSFNKLHYFSKFAQKYNQGRVDDIFKNVMVNNHQPEIHQDEDQKKKERNDKKYGHQAFVIIDKYALGEEKKDIEESFEEEENDKEEEDDKKEEKEKGFNSQVLKLRDPDNNIFSKKDEYRVFDFINNKREYNIARIENKVDNPYIRFRIVGGWNEGLSIRFTTFDKDEFITDFKIMTYFSEEKYTNAGLAWCSSLYKLDPELKRSHGGKICQNIQWAQMSPDQIYCKIVEYEISWPQGIENMTPEELGKLFQKVHDHSNIKNQEEDEEDQQKRFAISVIGMKVVLFNNQYERIKPRNWFYSMYDEDNDEIIGTQWIPDSEMISKENERQGVFYQLPAYEDVDYQYETSMVRSCLYQYYSSKTKSQKSGYVVIESQIADNLDLYYHQFSRHEVLDILNTELRCLLNMKMTTLDDVITPNVRIEDYDFLQSMEALGRYSIADFFLRDPEQTQKFTAKIDPQKIYKSHSILDDFIKNKGNLQSHRDFFYQNGLLRGQGCISFDRNLSNTLFRCFDNGTTLQMLRQQQQPSDATGFCKDFGNWISSFWKQDNKEEINQKNKQKAVLQMSGNHLLNYVLKKKPSEQENRFIFFLLEIFIEQGIQIESFFENESLYGYFIGDIFHKQFVTLLEMDSLPASSSDIATVRQLGDKHKLTEDFDENNDIKFMERYLSSPFENKDHGHGHGHEHEKKIMNMKENETENKDDDINETGPKLGKSIKVQIKEKADILFNNRKTAVGEHDHKQHKIQTFIFDRSSIGLDFKRIQLLNIQPNEKMIKYVDGKDGRDGKELGKQVYDPDTKKECYTDEINKEYLLVKAQPNWDLYDLSTFLNRVNLKYGKECEKHHVLMKLTDALFQESKYFYYKQMFFYCLYLVPFFAQLLLFDHMSDKTLVNFFKPDNYFYAPNQETSIFICNAICLFICFGFFCIELIQINIQGFSVYWNESRAFEFLWFPAQSLYFLMKLWYPNESYPLIDYVDSAILNGKEQTLIIMMAFALMNFFLIILISLKIFYFMTITPGFGTMITLITQTISQIQLFFLFYILMLWVFSCIMICLGYDLIGNPLSEDVLDNTRRVYSETSIAQYFIANFLNSVGQVNMPSIPVWKSMYDNPDTKIPGITANHKNLAYLMIVTVWVFWVVIVIFLFIILINFMVAYITQSYEDVLENKIRQIYHQRCDLNCEYYLYRRFMHNIGRRVMPKWNTFILSADFSINLGKSEESSNIGVIKNIQQTLTLDKEEIKYEVQQNRAEMERVKDEMLGYRNEMIQVIAGLPFIKEKVTTEFKQLLDKNNFNFMKDLKESGKFKDIELKKDAKKN